MKKLLLTLLLLLTFSLVSAQTEFTRNYTNICVVEKNKEPQWKVADNKFIFNYQGDSVIKIIMNDGSVRFFNQLTDLENGKTTGGDIYQAATFREQGTELTVYFQIFDSVKYGTRMIFSNGTMVQFTN